MLVMSVLSAVILEFFWGGRFWVCNQGSRRYYIQSAFSMESQEKSQQERASLLRVGDSFKKIIITSGEGIVHRDSHGIVTISLADFLLTSNALDL